MKVHNHLLGRHGKISRIDPTKIALEREALLAAGVPTLTEEPATQVAPEPEPEAKAEEPEAVSEPEPEAKAEEPSKVEIDIAHLLSLNATPFGEELITGKYDGVLAELLKAEESGRNRKGHKTRIEERVAIKAS